MPVDKIIDPNIATRLYGQTSNIAQNKLSASDEGVSFSDFLKEKTSESIDTMKASEKTAAQAVTGEADLTDVVEAVTAAELTLQTVVAVRDRLVGAYQEIMRMPI